MKEKNVTQYKLIKEFSFSSGQIDRLRKNADISTHTINRLCSILGCEVSDIMEYKVEPETSP